MSIWKLLSENLTATQIHQIEAALGTKLEQWHRQGQEVHLVFAKFAKTVLQDAFGQAWSETLSCDQRGELLSAASDGLFMDAVELFQHVLKGDTDNE